MARPRQVPGGRAIPIAVRLSPTEVATLDRLRGPMSRSGYLRALILRADRAPSSAPSSDPSSVTDELPTWDGPDTPKTESSQP